MLVLLYLLFFFALNYKFKAYFINSISSLYIAYLVFKVFNNKSTFSFIDILALYTGGIPYFCEISLILSLKNFIWKLLRCVIKSKSEGVRVVSGKKVL